MLQSAYHLSLCSLHYLILAWQIGFYFLHCYLSISYHDRLLIRDPHPLPIRELGGTTHYLLSFGA
jgi:hypothetical protein